MRKRVSRPRRFAAIDNDAIDGLPSVLSVGLLTCLIRAKDGDDVTVETLSDLYDEGEKSLTKAMRSLVEDAYVVKFKIQRSTTETVIEDGKEVEKRGGSWYTTFTVDSIPFKREDIAAMVAEIYAEGNIRSHRVEPTRLDPRNAPGEPPRRPAPPKGGVGATSGNADPEGRSDPADGGRPTPPSGAPGRPTPGQGGAHIWNKTFSPHTEHPQDENDAVSPRSGGDVRRTFTSGSSEVEVEGGVAASSKTSPPDDQHDDNRGPAGGQKSSSKKAKHTREQLTLVAAVRAHFPEHVLHGWTNPETKQVIEPLPHLPVISDAILGALAGDVPGADRSVEHLGARIEQRWNRHGYASRFYAGTMDNLVGSAVGMVRPLEPGDKYYCANGRCDDGVDVETLSPCGTCAVRIEAKQAERRQQRTQAAADGSNTGSVNTLGAMPAQRVVRVEWWDCATCDASGKGAAPEDGVCANCRRKRPQVPECVSGPPF
jgi:hypothetical protein